MKRKILVLGSNSFSGSDFIDLLLEDPDHQVVGVSRSPEKSDIYLPYLRHGRSNFVFHQMDLNTDLARFLELADAWKPEAIVNFAAQSEVAPSWDNPGHWFRTNAVALAEMANHLRRAPYLKKYVHISSPEVYGSCSGTVAETAPLNPSTPYAASKASGDLMLFTLFKNFGFPLVMIRSTNVYGPHQQLFKIIPRSAIRLKQGRTIELHGGGTAVKSYIHIRDVSRGELAALDRGRPGEIYHLSPDGGVAVRDVVRKICERMGCDYDRMTTAVGERQGQDAAYVIDSAKARKEFGWQPRIGLDQGLDEVVRWIQTRWDRIEREPHEYIHQS